jgi:tetratricopeptide (TPR) repeat protein
MVREPLSDSQRKRLEKVFDVANKKVATAKTPEDFDYVAKLAGQCIASDPGNAIYVRTFLDSLQKKYGDNRKGSPLAQFKERGARGAIKKAIAQEQWDEVIVQGLKVLAVNPWDTATLVAMYAAANKSGDRDCEFLYLQTAVKGNPKDYTCNRLMAVATSERGLISEAITWWHRVEDIRPKDEEAQRSIASLTVQKARTHSKFDEDSDEARSARLKAQQAEEVGFEQRLRRKIKSQPEAIENYLELAQFYVTEDRYTDAEPLLAKAQELEPANKDILEKLEDCQLRNMFQKMAHAKDLETKKKLQGLYFAKKIEVCKGRVERFPSNLLLKYELGYLYMKTKQYSEAIRELQIAQNDPRKKGVCMLALGECFAGIQQYRLALKHFEQAIQDIPNRDAENKKKAYYAAGKLALLALKDLDPAEKHLSALAGLDFNYKDVSKLLDKIAKLRENPEEPPKPPEKEPDKPEGNDSGSPG